MLERLTLAAALDQFAKVIRFRRGQDAVEAQVEAHAGELEAVSQEQFCLQPCGFDTFPFKELRAFLDDLKDRHAASLKLPVKVHSQNSLPDRCREYNRDSALACDLITVL